MDGLISGVFAAFQVGFKHLVDWLAAVLFFDIGGFPFIVLWLMVFSSSRRLSLSANGCALLATRVRTFNQPDRISAF